MRDLYALMAIALGGFVTGTVVQEFARGARARHRQYGEGHVVALGRLLARNRRRYGGYIVHTGIVILLDRKSTRLNSSHLVISYAVFCLKKKNTQVHIQLLV